MKRITQFEFLYDVLTSFQNGNITTTLCISIIEVASKKDHEYDYFEMLKEFNALIAISTK